MRDSEALAMIEGHMDKGNECGVGYRALTVTEAGDVFIAFCEKPENSLKPLKEQTVIERYQNKSGVFSMARFKETAIEARGNRITRRKAAQTLALTLNEFNYRLKEV